MKMKRRRRRRRRRRAGGSLPRRGWREGWALRQP